MHRLSRSRSGRAWWLLGGLWSLLLAWPAALPAQPSSKPAFEVYLDESVARQPVSGRILVLLSQRPNSEPRLGPDWFNPEPLFGRDVMNFAPGGSLLIDDSADSFPEILSKLPAGKYRAQAVLDHDFYEQHHAHGPGNFYSGVSEFQLDPARPGTVRLELDRVVSEPRFRETQLVREVSIRSELLSKFHGREVQDRCGVILPASYFQEPEKRYPVVYIVPGFGGSHRDASRYGVAAPQANPGEVEFIRVMLSGNCKWGHHVYADSRTNGPRDQALIGELIPHVDRTFRTVASPTARFLNGHSSGGWSSLWLQVRYPEHFGGVWSTSPDPVTFSDFQQIDLYAQPPQNMFTDPMGRRRPLARDSGNRTLLWYDAFCRMDDALGRGGQLRSFEAVFSPLDAQGQPRRLWDRATGAIDPVVAEAWKAYDIRLILEQNWPQLEPKLRGKLHVITGSLDTFYLDGAVALLASSLKQLGSDAEVTILAGESHSSLLRPELFQKIRRQMSARFLEHHGAGLPATQ